MAFLVILMSKSFTNAFVVSLAGRVPLLAVPGTSVQVIDAIKGSVPLAFTTIELDCS